MAFGERAKPFASRPPSGGAVPTLPGVVEKPDIREVGSEERTDGWIVTVFNNEYNTYEEVMTILVIATRCDTDEAYIETWEIDHLGKSVVHCGTQGVCSAVAEIISTIGIRVEVSQE